MSCWRSCLRANLRRGTAQSDPKAGGLGARSEGPMLPPGLPGLEIPNKTNGFRLGVRDPHQRALRSQQFQRSAWNPPGVWTNPRSVPGRTGRRAPFCWWLEPLSGPFCELFLSNNFASIVSLAQCRRWRRCRGHFPAWRSLFSTFAGWRRAWRANSIRSYRLDLERFSSKLPVPEQHATAQHLGRLRRVLVWGEVFAALDRTAHHNSPKLLPFPGARGRSRPGPGRISGAPASSGPLCRST